MFRIWILNRTIPKITTAQCFYIIYHRILQLNGIFTIENNVFPVMNCGLRQPGILTIVLKHILVTDYKCSQIWTPTNISLHIASYIVTRGITKISAPIFPSSTYTWKTLPTHLFGAGILVAPIIFLMAFKSSFCLLLTRSNPIKLECFTLRMRRILKLAKPERDAKCKRTQSGQGEKLTVCILLQK